MYAFSMLIWLMSFIVFIVLYLKKRKARKKAGENYKADKDYMRYSQRKRICGVICVLSLMVGIATAPDSSSTKDEGRPLVKQEVENDGTEVTQVEKKGDNDKANVEKQNITDVNKEIEKVCRDALGDDFVKAEINDSCAEGLEGTKIVMVTGNMQDGFSDKSIREMNILRAGDLFKELYTSGQPIGQVIYFVEADFIDKYGKESKGTAFKFYLNKPTADKIVWDNLISIDLERVLDDVWMMPQFRNAK